MKEENEVELRYSYWGNGQKWFEAPYVNGKLHGIETWWHENGQKWMERPWVNGQLHGIETLWTEDGSLFCVEKWNQYQRVVRFGFKDSNVPENRVQVIDILTKEFYEKHSFYNLCDN